MFSLIGASTNIHSKKCFKHTEIMQKSGCLGCLDRYVRRLICG